MSLGGAWGGSIILYYVGVTIGKLCQENRAKICMKKEKWKKKVEVKEVKYEQKVKDKGKEGR